MTKRSIPGIGKTRHMGLSVSERDDLNGSRFRGLHQGQRSREPQSKAGHMTAPTNFIIAKNYLAMRAPSTHEPPSDVCRKRWFSSATFYSWKAKFGGLEVVAARRLNALEADNRRLRSCWRKSPSCSPARAWS